MSYCRWSCDNFKSDLYCYEDVSGGWTTHVAGKRFIGDIPKLRPFPLNGNEQEMSEYWNSHRAQNSFLETAQRENIGLPHDGKTFNDDSLEDFRARVVWLMQAGYHAPPWLLEVIDVEIAETNAAPARAVEG